MDKPTTENKSGRRSGTKLNEISVKFFKQSYSQFSDCSPENLLIANKSGERVPIITD
jgi:hypothetical protein